MKVLVFGGHNFHKPEFVYKILTQLHQEYGFTCVVEGDAPGVDRDAGLWARNFQIDFRAYPAKWKMYGKAAGPIRNRHMLDENPNIGMAIAFPGGPGTADMLEQVKALGIKRVLVKYPSGLVLTES